MIKSYKTGTQFQEIVALYNFDFELRHALLKPILKIETHVKSRIAYRFSQQYGHDNYLKLANFDLGGGSRKRLKHATEAATFFPNLWEAVSPAGSNIFISHGTVNPPPPHRHWRLLLSLEKKHYRPSIFPGLVSRNCPRSNRIPYLWVY